MQTIYKNSPLCNRTRCTWFLCCFLGNLLLIVALSVVIRCLPEISHTKSQAVGFCVAFNCYKIRPKSEVIRSYSHCNATVALDSMTSSTKTSHFTTNIDDTNTQTYTQTHTHTDERQTMIEHPNYIMF